ncbi:MAG: response regulator [Alphaproteobacteria bacterium]|nr:response regulator [Alphaproteobacteria bacterium]
MRVITQPKDIEVYIKGLEHGVSADPASWQDWYALTVRAKEEGAHLHQDKVASISEKLLSNLDGAILCFDTEILIVVQKRGRFSFSEFTVALRDYMAPDVPRIELHPASLGTNPQYLTNVLGTHNVQGAFENLKNHDAYVKLKELLPHIEQLFSEWQAVVATRQGRTQPKILIVEDDIVTRFTVVQSLKSYETVVASTAAEAVERHIMYAPDIIFLDIGLPDWSGLQLIDCMREYDPHCCIIMFSADSVLDSRLKAFSSGADGFMPKPFNKPVFESYVADWVQKSRRVGS